MQRNQRALQRLLVLGTDRHREAVDDRRQNLQQLRDAAVLLLLVQKLVKHVVDRLSDGNAAVRQLAVDAMRHRLQALALALVERVEEVDQMAEEFGLENDIRVSTLSRYPEVFAMEEQPVDEEELWSSLEKALRGAFEPFVESRVREGENLKKDLCEKLDNMVSYVDFIEERSPQIIVEYRARLEEKLRELLADNQLDDSRIAQEVTIFADKICVDEETVRLKSHILSMKDSLNAGGSVGRKLDFLAQEMNREANTILSKSNDLKVSDTGISLKTDIEKVREQIQNIE